VRRNEVKTDEIGPIVLEHDDIWEGTITFTPVRASNNEKLEFFLYRNGGTEPYLEPLRLWVDVTE